MTTKRIALERMWRTVGIALFVYIALASGFASAWAFEQSSRIRIVAFGDSLTAGYMLPPEEAFPAQLAQALKAKGYDIEVTNAGVSGNTTFQGLARLDAAIAEETDAVILELGANDGLRGIDLKVTRANIEAIVAKLKARNIQILLAGMKLPKSVKPDYEAAFEAIYADLARSPDVLSYPYFLEGVANDPTLKLADGMHPNGKAVGMIVTRILPKVEELIARSKERRARVVTTGDKSLGPADAAQSP